jgi:hypothetical protein
MILDSYTCELCLHQRVESLRHLFLRCPFAKNCWATIGVLVRSWLRAERAIAYMRRAINKPFAMEVIITMSWCIWKERNTWIFNGEDPSVNQCVLQFKSELALVILRAKGQKKSSMEEWLENLHWSF